MSATPEKIILPKDLQDLSELTIEPVLAVEKEIPALIAKISLLPSQKYEQIIIHGFKRRLSNEEINNHPLVLLLHDFKHLMCHGNRGNRATRERKAKSKTGKAFENHYCRISMSYLISHDPETYDLRIKFAISVNPRPILTNYDGTTKRPMTGEEITNVVTNFIEVYLLEAHELIAGNATNCYFDNDIIIDPATEDKSET